MVQCKCYGDACMFVHKCRKTKRVEEWIELCDMIKDELQERFVDLIKTDTGQKRKIDLKIKIIYETFQGYCRAVNHSYIREILTDLNKLFPYVVENIRPTPIAEYENVCRAMQINYMDEKVLLRDYYCIPEDIDVA